MKNFNFKTYIIRSIIELIILNLVFLTLSILQNLNIDGLNLQHAIAIFIRVFMVSVVILTLLKLLKFFILKVFKKFEKDKIKGVKIDAISRLSAQFIQFIMEAVFGFLVLFVLLQITRIVDYFVGQNIYETPIYNFVFLIIILVSYFSPTLFIVVTKKMYGYDISGLKIVNTDNTELSRPKLFLRMFVKQLLYPFVFTITGLIGIFIFIFPIHQTKGKKDIVDFATDTKAVSLKN